MTILPCDRELALKKELTLAANTDITVAVTEPMTGRAEINLPIKVNCPAEFICIIKVVPQPSICTNM